MPIVTLPATHNTANCILVDGRVYCESRPVPLHDVGEVMLFMVLLIVWIILPVVKDFSARAIGFWYFAPPIIIAIGFLVFG